jgi:rod shape-determining protein MreC
LLDIRRSTGSLLLVVILAQVILISAQVQSKSGVRVLQVVTFGVFSRVQGGAFTLIHGSRNLWSNYVGLRGARGENATLKKQVADLEVRLQEQRALAARAVGLQQLMDLRVSTSLPTVAASVIAGNPNPGMRTITIDRGSADGVVPDMAVIAPQGVVGRVVGPVAAHASRVQLLIDRNAAAGALTETTRAGGLVVGVERDPALVMELVSNLEEVKPGDLVVASGVDGIYPKGIAIGRVEKAEKGAGLYRTITVRPTVNFSSLEEVLVVLVPPRPATLEEKDVPTAPGTPAGTAK